MAEPGAQGKHQGGGLTYPDAVEQAHAEYAELRRTDPPADTLGLWIRETLSWVWVAALAALACG